MTTVLLIVLVLVLASTGLIMYLRWKDQKSGEKSSGPVSNQNPTTEPPKEEYPVSEPEQPTAPVNGDPAVIAPVESTPVEPIFKVGDTITNGVEEREIQDLKPNGYLLVGAPPMYVPYKEQDQWTLVEKETEKDRLQTIFDGLVEEFSKIVPLSPSSKTCESLLEAFTEAYHQATATDNYDGRIYVPSSFPQILDVEGNKENPYVLEQMGAMLFYAILTEVVPEQRHKLARIAFNYGVEGNSQPIYGWSFYNDPNIARKMAAIITAKIHAGLDVEAMRKECGSQPITYKDDISELWLDLSSFLPAAPGPYLKDYSQRKRTVVGDVNSTGNLIEDQMVDDFVAEAYSLDSSSESRRQQTVQAIANKEHKVQHLFGKRRTVKDPKYGEMTFSPVFGKDTIGIDIPDNGAIANLAYTVGMACTNSRKPLLNAEYGRRRPGQGDGDPSAQKYVVNRALVNYPIEDGDGHKTGFYNHNGDYVDDKGNHIGDYETFYQSQLYANSYPSGHSAYIAGVMLSLIEVMPERTYQLIRATEWFRLSRCITRFHHLSDTTIGQICGMLFWPVLHATTNFNLSKLVKSAKEEYEKLNRGDGSFVPNEEPTPSLPSLPTDEKVNTSLTYSIGGYGSCHVDAGETALVHCCTKQCTKERHPTITLNQRVEFTIEGAGVIDDNGKTSGVWEANKAYGLICPAVKEDKYSYITVRNENGVKVLRYRLSPDGTHDDGPYKS